MNKTFVKAGLMLGLVLAPAFVFSAIAQDEGVNAGYAGPDAAIDAAATVELPPFVGGAEPSVVAPTEPAEPQECYSACACWNADGSLGFESAVCNMMCAPKPPLEKRCPGGVVPLAADGIPAETPTADTMMTDAVEGGDAAVSSEASEGSMQAPAATEGEDGAALEQ